MAKRLAISNTFRVNTIEDGVSYRVALSVSSVRIPADRSSVSLSFTATAYRRSGSSAEEPYPCYFTAFKHTESGYAAYSGTNGAEAASSRSFSLTVNNDTDAVSVCIFDHDSSSRSGYIAEALIPVSVVNGVTGVTEYYYASANGSTAPAVGSSDWETTIPVISDEKKYLWNYEKTVFADGNSYTTTPVVIAVHTKDGENGRGISSVTEYYLATDQSSSVTRKTTGWKTDPSEAVISSTKRYLWNYEMITWSDNSTTATDPALIGVYGAQGPQGETGRMLYYDGDYDSSKTYSRTAHEAPYVYYASKYYMLVGNGNHKGVTPGTNSGVWEVMTNDFKFIITEALFSAFGKLGSWVFSGDYMLSQQGVDGTETYNRFTGESGSWQPNLYMDAKTGRLVANSGVIGGVSFDKDGIGISSPLSPTRFTALIVDTSSVRLESDSLTVNTTYWQNDGFTKEIGRRTVTIGGGGIRIERSGIGGESKPGIYVQGDIQVTGSYLDADGNAITAGGGGGTSYTFDSSHFSVNSGTVSLRSSFSVSGNITAADFIQSSDTRLKDIRSDIGLTVGQIASAPSVLFKWNDGRDDRIHGGTTAQYWQKVAPWAVTADGKGMLAVSYPTLALAAAIACARETEELKRRIRELESKAG